MSGVRRPAFSILLLAGGWALAGAVAAQESAAGPDADAPVATETDAAAEVPPLETTADTVAPPTPPVPAEPRPLPPPAVPAGERVTLRQASVGIRSFEPAQTMAEAVRALEALGAYVQESETGRSELRIPADRLDAALAALRALGDVVREEVTSQDVTLEVATLSGRIDELETSRLRVQAMLELASTISDSLSVEQTLRTVTEELEAQQGRLRFLRQRTELAPLTLTVSMRERPGASVPQTRQPFPFVEQYGLDALLR